MEGVLEDVLAKLGVAARGCEPLKVVEEGNSSWRLETEGGATLALRRYHRGATVEAVQYEHAVLDHVYTAGWAVPHAVTDLIDIDGALYCATAFVPGSPREHESAENQAQRGRDLARLHLCLRNLDLGQRPGYRCQHATVTVHSDIDWERCVATLRRVDGSLADWAAAAAESTRAELAGLGADDLPVMVIHGDFASWNVHYSSAGGLAGVIDFGLTHLDSRPYELAIGRSYRAPAMVAAYRSELANLGWPLTPLELAAIEPIQRAFRVDMAAWSMYAGARAGSFDLVAIRSQLQRTGTAAPT